MSGSTGSSSPSLPPGVSQTFPSGIAITAPTIGDQPNPFVGWGGQSGGSGGGVATTVRLTGPAPTSEPGPARPERKVAIVGYTPSRDDALRLGPEWELWGMNNLHTLMPTDRFRRWYDLHPHSTIEKDDQHLLWLRSGASGLPVVVWEPRDEWPTAVAFPRREIVDRFGSYFTNTVSWQIAHALYEGVTHLGVYGIDMAVGGEYAGQRPSCEYFIGLARGLGVEVTIAESSDLLRAGGMYGTDDDPSGFRGKIEQRVAELQSLQAQAAANREHNDRLWHQCQGALENLNYLHDVWTMPAAKRDGPST